MRHVLVVAILTGGVALAGACDDGARGEAMDAKAVCRTAEESGSPTGEFLGAFATTVENVIAESQRLYGKTPEQLRAKDVNKAVALCYYDVSALPQRSDVSLERVSVVVEEDTGDSIFLHGGRAEEVPVRSIG